MGYVTFKRKRGVGRPYGKQPARKKRRVSRYHRGPSKMLAAKIKQVIHRTVIPKCFESSSMTTDYAGADSFGQINSHNLLSNINYGTDDDQRLGDTIFVKNFVISGRVSAFNNAAHTGADYVDHQWRILVIKHTKYNTQSDGQYAANQFSNDEIFRKVSTNFENAYTLTDPQECTRLLDRTIRLPLNTASGEASQVSRNFVYNIPINRKYRFMEKVDTEGKYYNYYVLFIPTSNVVLDSNLLYSTYMKLKFHVNFCDTK